MKRGFDIDGVLTPLLRFNKKWKNLKGAERKKYLKAKREHYKKFDCYFELIKDDVLITGRRETYKNITLQWLKSVCKPGIPEVKFLPNGVFKHNGTITKHKAEWINKLNIGIFYEDDLKTFNKLLNLCPNCKIQLMEPEIIEVKL
jgi:hypothetical protein